MGTTGPRPLSACSTERRGRAAVWLGASAQGRPSPARPRRDAMPRRRSRRHGGAGATSGPAAVAGHVRASGRALGVRKKVANLSRLPKGMEKGRGKRFHGEAKHGGAMTDGSETCKAAIPCSNGVPTASTRCRRARRSDVCSIAGNGGPSATNFAGGAAVAMAARAELGAW